MWAPYHTKDGTIGDFTADWTLTAMVFHVGAGMLVYAHIVDDDVNVLYGGR